MNRRQIMKLAPLAALSGVAMKLGNVEAKAVEVDKAKQYVFMVPAKTEPDVLIGFQKLLNERGINATIITDNVSIYEL